MLLLGETCKNVHLVEMKVTFEGFFPFDGGEKEKMVRTKLKKENDVYAKTHISQS